MGADRVHSCMHCMGKHPSIECDHAISRIMKSKKRIIKSIVGEGETPSPLAMEENDKKRGPPDVLENSDKRIRTNLVAELITTDLSMQKVDPVRICHMWNEVGKCRFGTLCRFIHACSKCFIVGHHMNDCGQNLIGIPN